jgi:hypothetical protein
LLHNAAFFSSKSECNPKVLLPNSPARAMTIASFSSKLFKCLQVQKKLVC